MYSCVRMIDDHEGELAHPHLEDLGWITCGSSKKRKPRIGDWLGFQAL